MMYLSDTLRYQQLDIANIYNNIEIPNYHYFWNLDQWEIKQILKGGLKFGVQKRQWSHFKRPSM